jgi:hypothetical protein
MNKDLSLIDYMTYLSDKRGEDQIGKLKELSLMSDKVFKEMYSYRIAQKRVKKIKKIWVSKL